MGRQLTFEITPDCYMKVYQAAVTKVYGINPLWCFVLGLTVVGGIITGEEMDRISPGSGVWISAIISLILILVFGQIRVWSVYKKSAEALDDAGRIVRFVVNQNDDGLQFKTDMDELYVKWQGIAEIAMIRDGVALNSGLTFCVVPNSAFDSEADKLAFIRDVYARLREPARVRSEKHVRSALKADVTAM